VDDFEQPHAVEDLEEQDREWWLVKMFLRKRITVTAMIRMTS
jgi:hypothetical protein